MSRNSTQVLNNIRILCRIQKVNEKTLYDRSRLILTIYRDVCWSTMGRADEVHEDLICTCGASLDNALIYLETFAPDEARERFEERIRSLFETKWIIELVDHAMGRIREYPCKGDLYCEIISKSYLIMIEKRSYSAVRTIFVRKLHSNFKKVFEENAGRGGIL